METLYDFSELSKAITHLKTSIESEDLQLLKEELNKFFIDSECREVIYTKNTDKMAFGVCVIPKLTQSDAINILTSNDEHRIDSYYLELDSKLFDVGLTSIEIVAILIYEISRVVNTSEPIERVRQSIDIYMDKNNTCLKFNGVAQYGDILAFGIKDSIRKLYSMFEKTDNEILANEFMVSCSLAMHIESAYKRIVRYLGTVNNEANNRLIVLHWVLRLYQNVKFKRIDALHILEEVKNTIASELVIREINIVIRALNQIDDDSLIQESLNVIKNINKRFKNFKFKGMRVLEDDLYELRLRIKNVDIEDEALIILREINSRLSIIDDYLSSEKLDEDELNRWFRLRNNYLLLREELSKKTTYQDKYYGLFVQYPVKNK